MKTSNLTGAALDWAVATCQNVECDEDNEPIWFEHDGAYAPRCPYKPSTNWAQGGPIIEREKIAIDFDGHSWCASDNAKPIANFGDTPLIAAMRCYVSSKLGSDVEVPSDLL